MAAKLTPKELGDLTRERADFWWGKLRKLYPSITRETPRIVFNKRLKTTAGRAFIERMPQNIDLSNDLLWEHTDNMLNDTLPHELCRLVAFTVYGDPGHGTGWKKVMNSVGIPPVRCHSMVNSSHEARKASK